MYIIGYVKILILINMENILLNNPLKNKTLRLDIIRHYANQTIKPLAFKKDLNIFLLQVNKIFLSKYNSDNSSNLELEDFNDLEKNSNNNNWQLPIFFSLLKSFYREFLYVENTNIEQIYKQYLLDIYIEKYKNSTNNFDKWELYLKIFELVELFGINEIKRYNSFITEDLISESKIYLFKAIMSYNPEKGKFLTHFSVLIKNMIQKNRNSFSWIDYPTHYNDIKVVYLKEYKSFFGIDYYSYDEAFVEKVFEKYKSRFSVKKSYFKEIVSIMVWGSDNEIELNEDNEHYFLNYVQDNEKELQKNIDLEILHKNINNCFKNSNEITKILINYLYGIKFDNYYYNGYKIRILDQDWAEKEVKVIAQNERKAILRIKDWKNKILSTLEEVKNTLEVIDMWTKEQGITELYKIIWEYYWVGSVTKRQLYYIEENLKDDFKKYITSSLKPYINKNNEKNFDTINNLKFILN